jgi:hypothetical protein
MVCLLRKRIILRNRNFLKGYIKGDMQFWIGLFISYSFDKSFIEFFVILYKKHLLFPIYIVGYHGDEQD